MVNVETALADLARFAETTGYLAGSVDTTYLHSPIDYVINAFNIDKPSTNSSSNRLPNHLEITNQNREAQALLDF